MQNIKLISLDNKMTAAQWLAQQTVKPKNIINGSLWSSTRPVGTIYQDGKVIWDSGNADGFGVDMDGVPRFGRAYGDIKWRDFLSGYPGLIKEGKALTIPGGNAVYTSKATRSVVYMQGGLVRFACFPAQTMAALQTKLLQLGATEAIALDGGGSCFLYDNGVQTEYQSKDNKGDIRKLANILVEYETEESIDGIPLYRKLCKIGAGNNPELGMRPTYITIHNTGNYAATANAKNNAAYVYGGSNGAQSSWHYTVDRDEIWQTFEDTRRCWHAGDGTNGPGNATSIGIEICVHDKAGFVKACQNAAKLTAHLLKKHGLTVDRVVQHNHWSGKNCPAEIRAGNWGVDWGEFLSLVRMELAPPAPVTPPGTIYRVQVGAFAVKSNADNLIKALEAKGFPGAFIVEGAK